MSTSVRDLRLPDAFLLDEYRTLWEYYNRTVDERHKLLEYTFKTISFIIGILTIVGGIFSFSGKIELSTQIYSIMTMTFEGPYIIRNTILETLPVLFILLLLSVLLVCLYIGVFCFFGYVKETANSFLYLKGINRIRDYIIFLHPEIKDSLVFGGPTRLKTKKREITCVLTVPFCRISPIVALNSLIISFLSFLFNGLDPLGFIGCFFLICAFFSVTYFYALWEFTEIVPNHVFGQDPQQSGSGIKVPPSPTEMSGFSSSTSELTTGTQPVAKRFYTGSARS